mgnify:FL=1
MTSVSSVVQVQKKKTTISLYRVKSSNSRLFYLPKIDSLLFFSTTFAERNTTYNINLRIMKKNLIILAFLLGGFHLSSQAQKQEKNITIEVHNNWNQAKTDAPIVINLHELHADFKIKSAVVMEGTNEVPSQLDDLDKDRKMDELAFVADLPAHGRKTFQVTLSSEKSTKTYPERVYADMFIADHRKGKHQRVQAITVPGSSNIYSLSLIHI